MGAALSINPVRQVVIAPAVLELLRATAERSFPSECCGVLLGKSDGSTAVIGRARPVDNEARTPGRFYVGPRQMWRAIRDADAVGQHLLGIYHSHPRADVRPSAIDRRGAWPEHLQLITGYADGAAARTRCWQLLGGTFAQVPILPRLTDPARD